MSTVRICPCGEFVHPRDVLNPPGQAVVRYRTGDFASFREALLLPLDGEVELRQWRPGATGDLAVQIVEWWAVLADILTFYDERGVNQFFLRTADQTEAVNGLVRLLGYRPRPGIGATGYVAALVKGLRSVVVPTGFQIQSKPGPGQTPQVFEVDAATTAFPVSVADVDAPAAETVSTSVLLAGEGSGIKAGDRLLLANRGWAANAGDFAAIVTVKSLTPETDPRGKKNTRIEFTAAVNPPSGVGASDLQLFRTDQFTGLWQYPAASYFTSSEAHVASITRQMQVNTPVVIEAGSSTYYISVTSNSEVVWFANPPDSNHPETGPKPTDAVPIPIPHTVIGFKGTVVTSVVTANRSTARFRYGWTEVGRIIAAPATSFSAANGVLTTLPGVTLPALKVDQQILIEDAALNGALAKVASASAGSVEVKDLPTLAAPLEAPLRTLFNLLPVSRGKSVPNEVLGSGDATQPGQEFLLKKSPLTYLPGADPSGTQNYHSTLRVWVNGIEWKEVPSFYGQPADAKIFVTREDADSKTHVQFGDGVNGSRVPTGVSNVVAAYRYESGAAVPDTGKLTVMLKPIAGLKGIANPVQPAGGSDPDSPDRLRVLAPKSVLTFNRAVSGADYEAIAAEAPGVARAKAYWSFDAVRQQTAVTVYVGDTAGAVTAAKTALANAVDPNKPLTVKQAVALPIVFAIQIAVDPAYQVDAVKDGVKAALTDPDTGLFGLHNVRIGQTVFRSHVHDACLRVPGVIAARLSLAYNKSTLQLYFLTSYRAYAGEGGFFQLAPEDLYMWVAGS